ATGAFEGSITVTPEGRFTEAYQSNRNILAGDKARMHTKPQLLIFNDDVKCSHGATTGQLDQQALFYMRTRGIPYAEARTMLMQAFMADVVDTVRLDTLRDRLHYLVENRLAGRKTSCHTCHSGCHIKIDNND
ncbi:MAG: SufD family Fe-S cluster assembly protein, partial [Muribaculaceae bacterium]|nr:SufD family Fe-S cluster assembly protein [Muribaculaceae bacterium]